MTTATDELTLKDVLMAKGWTCTYNQAQTLWVLRDAKGEPQSSSLEEERAWTFFQRKPEAIH